MRVDFGEDAVEVERRLTAALRQRADGEPIELPDVSLVRPSGSTFEHRFSVANLLGPRPRLGGVPFSFAATCLVGTLALIGWLAVGPLSPQAGLEDTVLADSADAPSPDGPDPSLPSSDLASSDEAAEIVDAGGGLFVHVSIVDNVRRLLGDAKADGILLSGGGYRDPQGLIEARREACGTSEYAIFEMPASECDPPSARPGLSMHERGLAIDFTCSGELIRHPSGPCWEWLNQNAAEYGLIGLSGEPWHWSTDGT